MPVFAVGAAELPENGGRGAKAVDWETETQLMGQMLLMWKCGKVVREKVQVASGLNKSKVIWWRRKERRGEGQRGEGKGEERGEGMGGKGEGVRGRDEGGEEKDRVERGREVGRGEGRRERGRDEGRGEGRRGEGKGGGEGDRVLP